MHLRCKEKDLQTERQQEERSRPQNLHIERPRGKREEQKLTGEQLSELGGLSSEAEGTAGLGQLHRDMAPWC